MMVFKKTRRLWTEAGGVAHPRDISMVRVTMRAIAEIAEHS